LFHLIGLGKRTASLRIQDLHRLGFREDVVAALDAFIKTEYSSRLYRAELAAGRACAHADYDHVRRGRTVAGRYAG